MQHAGLTFGEWRIREGLTYRELAGLLNCTVNLAYAYCLDPGDGAFRRPRDDRMARIYEVSNGEVAPGSFYRLPKITRRFDRAQTALPLDSGKAAA